MKKIEMIAITEPSYPQKSSIKKKIDNFYSERNNIISNAFSIDETLEINEKKNIFSKNIQKINNAVETLLHQYVFLKLFNRAAKRNGMFNVKIIEFDKYFNKLKLEVHNVEKNFNNIKKNDDLFEHSYQELVYNISDLFSFIEGIKIDLKSFEDKYYPKMRVTAYNLCEGKSSTELEELTNDVNKYIQQFKSFEEAFDYICYNSGVLITDTIDALLSSFKKAGFNVGINYFLKSEVVIAFSYYEWVDLIGKIKKVLNKYKNVTLNDRFKELYNELMIRYTIIVICNALMEG